MSSNEAKEAAKASIDRAVRAMENTILIHAGCIEMSRCIPGCNYHCGHRHAEEALTFAQYAQLIALKHRDYATRIATVKRFLYGNRQSKSEPL